MKLEKKLFFYYLEYKEKLFIDRECINGNYIK